MSSIRFTILVTSLYACLLAVVMYFHEPWRDELHSWSIVLASSSLPELVSITSHEGHPLLWYLLLYPISKLTTNYLGFQMLQWCIAVATTYLIVKHSPFSHLQKAMLVFGYFFFYEYGVISRNYEIGVLLFFSVIVIYLKYPAHKGIYYILLLLLLMAQCSLFAVLLACATALLVYKHWWEGKISTGHISLFTLIGLLGICLSLYLIGRGTTTVEANNLLLQGFDFGKLRSCLMNFSKPVFPIPVLGKYDNWNAPITSGAFQYPLLICLGVFIATTFRNDPWLWIILLAYATASMVCYYFRFFGSLRHHGYFYMLLIGCIWLKRQQPVLPKPFIQYVFSLILGVHFLVGIYFSVKDIYQPFTQAKACAAFIQTNITDGETFMYVGHNDYKTQGIATLCQQKFYFPATQSFQSYVTWDGDPTLDFPKDSASFALCIQEARKRRKTKIIFILTQKQDSITTLKLGTYLKGFAPSMVGDENYYLYLKTLN